MHAETPASPAQGVSSELPLPERISLAVQRAASWLAYPLTMIAVPLFLRLGRRLRFEDCEAIRSAFRREREQAEAPLLVCGNHLTMVDSMMIAYALGSPRWYLWNFSSFPWNVPDQKNFAAVWWKRIGTYLLKCIPIERGGSRQSVSKTLHRVAHLLRRGEVGLVFPEGGRSRSGRVSLENAAYGVGRIVKGVAGCRVLCVYLRGDAQHSYSALPVRRDTIRARIAWLEPKTELQGVRASLDISRQILRCLAELETEHFDAPA